jgi:hypothetical protein
LASDFRNQAIKLIMANENAAGIYTQETHTRMAILSLLEACRERSGWPVKPLGVELQQIWEKQDSI